MDAEDEKSNEVEKCGPNHRITRPQHARRHEGCNGVCRVVKTVEKVECKCDRDQADQQRQAQFGGHVGLKLIDNYRIDLIGNILKAVNDFF